MAFPTYSAPIRPDNPVPKIVKAKPVATWLVANTRAKKPKTIEVRRPDNAPKITARNRLPVVITVIEAITAPISIIPSTPKLSTPLLSTTSSPVAASIIGIEDKITAIINSNIINSLF